MRKSLSASVLSLARLLEQQSPAPRPLDRNHPQRLGSGSPLESRKRVE